MRLATAITEHVTSTIAQGRPARGLATTDVTDFQAAIREGVTNTLMSTPTITAAIIPTIIAVVIVVGLVLALAAADTRTKGERAAITHVSPDRAYELARTDQLRAEAAAWLTITQGDQRDAT